MSTTHDAPAPSRAPGAASSTRRSTAWRRSSSSSAATSSTTPPASSTASPTSPCSPTRSRTSSAAPLVVLGVLLAVATAPRRPCPRPRRARTSTSPSARDWRTVGLLAGVFVAQHRPHRLARLGDHRRAALRRHRLRARQPPTWSATSRSAPPCRSAPGTASTSASASRSPPASWTECSDGHLLLLEGFARRPDPDQPAVRRDRRPARHRRRRAARHRPGDDGGPAAARRPTTSRPSSALIMFAGIYYGGMYGGSTTSILLNTPGESSSVVTAIEGNKMAKAGRAAQALATAAIGSFVAGTIGTVLLVLFAPPIADARRRARRAVVLRDHAARAVRGDRRARALPAARLHRAVPRPGDRPDRHARPASRG